MDRKIKREMTKVRFNRERSAEIAADPASVDQLRVGHSYSVLPKRRPHAGEHPSPPVRSSGKSQRHRRQPATERQRSFRIAPQRRRVASIHWSHLDWTGEGAGAIELRSNPDCERLSIPPNQETPFRIETVARLHWGSFFLRCRSWTFSPGGFNVESNATELVVNPYSPPRARLAEERKPNHDRPGRNLLLAVMQAFGTISGIIIGWLFIGFGGMLWGNGCLPIGILIIGLSCLLGLGGSAPHRQRLARYRTNSSTGHG